MRHLQCLILVEDRRGCILIDPGKHDEDCPNGEFSLPDSMFRENPCPVCGFQPGA